MELKFDSDLDCLRSYRSLISWSIIHTNQDFKEIAPYLKGTLVDGINPKLLPPRLEELKLLYVPSEIVLLTRMKILMQYEKPIKLNQVIEYWSKTKGVKIVEDEGLKITRNSGLELAVYQDNKVIVPQAGINLFLEYAPSLTELFF